MKSSDFTGVLLIVLLTVAVLCMPEPQVPASPADLYCPADGGMELVCPCPAVPPR